MAQRKIMEKVDECPAMMVSDIHGNYAMLYRLFAECRVSKDGKNYLNRKMIFLGDYVDRGKQSLRCAVFVALLAIVHPNETILLRGNHEFREINRSYGFLEECIELFGFKDGNVVWEEVNKFFDQMPLVALFAKKILCLHGGVSLKMKSLNAWDNITRPLTTYKNKLVKDTVWADCIGGLEIGKLIDEPIEAENKLRGCSVAVNGKVIDMVCENLGIICVIRGHEYNPEGVMFYADNKFITIFSSANYEGKHNTGAVMMIDRNLSYYFMFYREENTIGHDPVPDDLLTIVEDSPNIKLEAEKRIAKRTMLALDVQDPQHKPDVKLTTPPVKKIVKAGSKGMPSWRPQVNVMTIAMICAMIVGLASGAPSSPPNALSQFATNSSTLARFVNGISLGQSISEGKLDKKQLIDEFFYLGPDVTLDSLAASKVSQLADELAPIQKMIETECSGDDGCGVSKAVLDAMLKVDELRVHVPAVETASAVAKKGALEDVNKISYIVGQIKDITEQSVTDLISSLETMDESRTKDKMKGFLKACTKIEDLALISTYLKDKQNLVSDFEKTSLFEIKKDLHAIEPIVDVTKKLIDYHKSVKLLKEELTSIRKKYQSLASSVQMKTLQGIISKTDILIKVTPFLHKDRILTPGFPGGFEDISKVASFDKDTWIQNFLTSNGNLTAVSSEIDRLKSLQPQLEPLHLKFGKLHQASDARPWILKSSLSDSVDVILEFSTSVSSYLGCIKSMNLLLSLNKGIVQTTLKNLELSPEVKNDINSLNRFLSQVQQSLDVLSIFNRTVEPVKIDITDLVTLIQSNTFLTDAINALKQLRDAVKNKGELIDLAGWLSTSSIEYVTDQFDKWYRDSHFMSTMDCLKDKGFNKIFESLNPSAKNIATLKPGNKEVESIIAFAKSLDELSSEWTKLKPTLASKPKRAVESNLKNAQKVSKDLGDFSSITLKLDGMLKSEGDVNALIGGKQVVESAIGAVKDQEEQDRLKKMWTPENLAALQKNLATAKAVSAVVSKNKIVGNMTDFKAPFEKASEVQGCSIDVRRLASSLKGKIQDQTVAASLESSKTLDLQFVKYDVKRVGGVITDLQSYFDSVFGIKKSKTCDPDSSSCDAAPKSSGLPSWAIYAIVAACVVLVTAGVAGLLIWFCCFYLKNKKQEKKKTPEEIEEELRKENARREAELKRLHEIKMTEQQLVEKVGKQDVYFPYFNPLFARPNVPPADGVNKVATSNTKTVEEKKAEIMKDITHEDIAVKEEVPKKILEDNKPHILGLLKQRKYSQAGINAFFEKLEEYFVNFMAKTKISWKRLATVPEALTQEMFFAPMIDVPQPKPESLAEKKAIGPLLAEKNTLIIIGSNDQIIRNRNKPRDASTKTGQSTKTSQSTKTVPPPSTKTSRPTEEIGTARDLTEETDAKSARTAVSISERRGSSGSDLSTESVKLNLYQNSNDDISVDKTESEASLLTPRSSLHDLEAGTIPDSSPHYGAFNCGAPCGHSHTFDNERRRYREWTPEELLYIERDPYPKLTELEELKEKYEYLETLQQIDKRKRDVMGPPITSPNDVYFVKERELERLGERIQELERAESAKQEILVLEQQAEKLSEQDERNPLLQVMPI